MSLAELKYLLLREYMRHLGKRRPKCKLKPTQAKRIALWQFGGVGDMLLATPVIQALGRLYPEAKIHVWCSDPAFAVFLRRFPNIEAIHSFPVYEFDSRTLLHAGTREELYSLLTEMRAFLPEFLVNLHVPALLDWWAVEWWLISRLPDCFCLGFDPRFIREETIYDASLNASARDHTHYPVLYQHLLQKAAVVADVQTRFPLADEELLSAKNILLQQNLAAEQQAVCMHIGARRLKVEGKMWPLDNFALLAEKLLDQGYVPLLTGVESEKELADALCSRVPECRNLAGKTSLGEMAALISLSSGFIGHDSGPFHVAASVGCPCVVICGRPDAEPEYLNYEKPDIAVLTADSPESISVDDVLLQAVRRFRHG